MSKNQDNTSKIKEGFHSRNPHKHSYDFGQLIGANRQLKKYVVTNKFGIVTIDFSNPKAVMELNRAILMKYYKLRYWDIPSGYLCPPIPGRADYIHYMADLLFECNGGKKIKGSSISAIDVGTGANLIYPIVGAISYGWNFIGSDIDDVSILSAEKIIESNDVLQDRIQVRQQSNKSKIFKDIILPDEKYDITLCNPPFHGSRQEAREANLRKRTNLKLRSKEALNFGGENNELWCEGGELSFIKRMIEESKFLKRNCLWHSSLISKKENVNTLRKRLEKEGAKDIRVVRMEQGQKASRFIAWTFHDKESIQTWKKTRWI